MIGIDTTMAFEFNGSVRLRFIQTCSCKVKAKVWARGSLYFVGAGRVRVHAVSRIAWRTSLCWSTVREMGFRNEREKFAGIVVGVLRVRVLYFFPPLWSLTNETCFSEYSNTRGRIFFMHVVRPPLSSSFRHRLVSQTPRSTEYYQGKHKCQKPCHL